MDGAFSLTATDTLIGSSWYKIENLLTHPGVSIPFLA
jgi:hypothetical protein